MRETDRVTTATTEMPRCKTSRKSSSPCQRII